MKKNWITGFILMVMSVLPMATVSAQNDLLLKQQQIEKLVIENDNRQSEIKDAENKCLRASINYEELKKVSDAKKSSAEKAKDEYLRASQNADIVAVEQLVKLAQVYKDAEKDRKDTEEALKRLEGEKKYLDDQLIRIRELKKSKDREIVEIKADIFDMQVREPVWVEGTGEAVLSEDKTLKECELLALEYAKRDAVERGGKALLESYTKIEMNQVVIDQIQMTASAQVLEQDITGDYGKSRRVIEGNWIKYVAKVRLKIQSNLTYNPFREKAVDPSKLNENSSFQTENEIKLDEKTQSPPVISPLKPIISQPVVISGMSNDVVRTALPLPKHKLLYLIAPKDDVYGEKYKEWPIKWSAYYLQQFDKFAPMPGVDWIQGNADKMITVHTATFLSAVKVDITQWLVLAQEKGWLVSTLASQAKVGAIAIKININDAAAALFIVKEVYDGGMVVEFIDTNNNIISARVTYGAMRDNENGYTFLGYICPVRE